MDLTEIRRKMARLWKETFHDSDDYISLVFDNYFDPELIEFEEIGGDVAAALMGIPYHFGNAERSLPGLYLCGLATKPQYRSRGIMTSLLTRINEKARDAGFAFTFLIPSDEGLRKYYHDREYVNAFYRVIDNYTSLHDFDREFESILMDQKEKVAELKRRHYYSLKAAVYSPEVDADGAIHDGIRSLIREIEDSQQDFQLLHSDNDIDILIRENQISGGKIHYVCNSAGRVTAVAFTTVFAVDSAVNVHKLFSSDIASKYKALGFVKSSYPDLAIRHFVPSIEMDRKALWLRTYGSFMKDIPQSGAVSITERVYSLAAHAKVYGMVRILDFAEILKFQAECRRDLKYSILAKADENDSFVKIEARDGELRVKNVDAELLTHSQAAHVMSIHDIGEILFRRRDTDNIITEAFGIPSINASICLMLD